METAVSIDLGHVVRDLDLPRDAVERTVALLDEGNTVPFITRYRKDQTGGLDEEQIRSIRQKVTKLRLLAERKATILKSIESQGKLTPKLAGRIKAAQSTKRLEDLYLPYKLKKQTLATLARQRGLEPLATDIFEGAVSVEQLAERATQLVRVDKELYSVEDVMLGVGHLLAERFSERAELRWRLRKILWRTGKLVSSVVPEKKTSEERGTETEDVVDVPRARAASVPDGPADPSGAPRASAGLAAAGTPAQQTGSPAEPQGSSDESRRPNPMTEALASKGDRTDANTAADTDERSSAETAGEGFSPAGERPSSGTGPNRSDGPAPPETVQPRPAHRQPRSKKERKRLKQIAAFKDYFDYGEAVRSIPPHRVLAINRGERAKILRVKLEADSEAIQEAAEKLLVPPDHPHRDFLRGCVRDALTRLVLPALEREIRRELTDRAERHAVGVFARNLRKLLLQPPVRDRRVLAIDPGFRNGCKMAALDQFGNVLGHDVIHVVGDQQRRQAGRQRLVEMIRQHGLSVIAIGNGTGCRAAEQLAAEVIANELNDRPLEYVIVNEAGASVYSTSGVGREELPDYDATVRGAISIGRRLLDPLSELVKINAANIGVGLYQHDVKASHLRESLDEVVASCVNYVGVDVNTASPALLRYVSGLNQLTARRLYEHRQEHGPFRNREQLKEVAGFGEATFVQSAGFLKIIDGDNPLDATWIHPESYEVAARVLQKLGSTLNQLRQSPAPSKPPGAEAAAREGAGLADRVAQLDTRALAEELGIGRLLLQDILASITRPGRDPREDLPPPVFRRGIMKLEDLKPGMELTGTVLNVVDFGAFVDIGLSDSGLVHISRLANRFVGDPHEVVGVGDVLKVWVVEVDKVRRRVSLTAIRPGSEKSRGRARQRKDRGPSAPGEMPRRAGRAKQDQKPQGRPSTGTQVPKQRTSRRSKRRTKPVTPITQAMVEGKEPMRSFSDLKQFFEQKKQEAEQQQGEDP